MSMNDGFLDESTFSQFNDDANASLTESISVIARECEVGEEDNQVSEYVIDSFCVPDSDCEVEKLPSDDVSCRLGANENEEPETVLRKRLPPRSARPSQPMCSSPQEPQRTSLIRTKAKQPSLNSPVDGSTNDRLVLKDLYPELNSKDASKLLKEPSRYSSSISNCSEESEDDDKAFEKYLQTLRTPIANASKQRVCQNNLSSFVVNDSDSTDDASSPWTSNERVLVHETIGDSDSHRKLNFSGDKENSSLLILDTIRRRRHIPKGKMKKTVNVMAGDSWSDTESDEEKKVAETDFSRDASSTASFEQTFLRSLSPSCPEYQRHSDTKLFTGKLFKKNRTDLCDRLFRIFNEKIFALKLPVDLPLQWNVRLRKTSGRCCYRRSADGVRTARIELSTKVCDSADRVRDTLIHEMCHAAVWLIDGDMNGGHGPNWRLWANHACCIFPSLPMISRCHAYEIKAKFVYQCGQCKQEIKRHSKSVDIERKVCGYCRGRFSLLINGKPAAAQISKTNKFAQFVKNNYGAVKTASKSHKDVMAELGEQFKTLASI